jgi:AraC-like DNA-binding protein
MTRAVSVRRHESELGVAELATRAPHPALRAHVLRLQGYQERTAGPLRRAEPPQGAATLIVSFGPELRLPEAGVRLRSFLAGPDDAFTVTEHDGEAFGLQVDLTPFAAGALFGVEPGELARSVVPLEDAPGRAAVALVERLQRAAGWDERLDAVEAVLGPRLARSAGPPAGVEWAWRRIVASGGRVTVGELAAELGWSRRHFGARFREHVGLPPKLVARIVRFRRALTLLQAGRHGLAEIAYACGYADQAHLSREVRALAATTPTELVSRLLPDGLGVEAERATIGA